MAAFAASDISVYPRVCGGTWATTWSKPAAYGLSPRVRGNLRYANENYINTGSIPACAGEPARLITGHPPSTVYPRVCGGTCCTTSNRLSHPGLSPRVRGNPPPRPPGRHGPRSIPACAGEPYEGTIMVFPPPVYPRVCGGTLRWDTLSGAWYGLSPRVRGNLMGTSGL